MTETGPIPGHCTRPGINPSSTSSITSALSVTCIPGTYLSCPTKYCCGQGTMGSLVNWKSGTNGFKLFQTFGTLRILVYLSIKYMSSMNFEVGLSLKRYAISKFGSSYKQVIIITSYIRNIQFHQFYLYCMLYFYYTVVRYC